MLTLDHTITNWLYGGRVLPHGWENLLYGLASFFVYLLPVILIVLFFKNYRDRLNSIKIFLIAVVSWQVLNKSIGSFLYNHYGFRNRPFADYGGTKEFFFEQPQKAFPSDHAAVLIAVALSLIFYRYPKLGWVFLIGGVLSSLARVVIGFHWFGDVIGGWAIGAITWGVFYLLDTQIDWLLKKIPYLDKLVYEKDTAK
ncbi:MAG TPA: phosphatase PAP2 family protein [Candidatus Saccharimonadales bacterium]|nr:phosphatase PAP2 family protein [Candidatus Saccharimonadales bacterium]